MPSATRTHAHSRAILTAAALPLGGLVWGVITTPRSVSVHTHPSASSASSNASRSSSVSLSRSLGVIGCVEGALVEAFEAALVTDLPSSRASAACAAMPPPPSPAHW